MESGGEFPHGTFQDPIIHWQRGVKKKKKTIKKKKKKTSYYSPCGLEPLDATKGSTKSTIPDASKE